jgi:hypothetical protein
MEKDTDGYKSDLLATSKMVVLDYLFGEGEEMQAYQLVRFAEGEAWNVLSEGLLLASLKKNEAGWWQVIGENLSIDMVKDIGAFIDAQHFNLLPAKIRHHWQEYVAEVIMQNDSLYLVIALQGINFERFKKMFTSFIGELVEDPWAVEFKVYNGDFTNEFIVRVF